MLRCVECGRETVGSTLNWRPYLTVNDEVCVYCPDCAEPEFGARGEGPKRRREQPSE